MNWDKFENGFMRWFDKSFPKFVLGLVITLFCILIIGGIIGGIKGCITNHDKDYCVEFQDGSGKKYIYLNEGDFEITDGRIIIKDGEVVYYLTNFKLINNK
mgnify:CR=1 FL=1